ncbi:TnsA endonuclease N-terminal domain-containing protein [Rhodoferax sediminis]|uniref:TnsA endonuclease N-terminal domain-containing protein n=1 Tax=Rhodoferax sediminis TaxID=2509614 RepID=A0A515D7L6_9BURK|nr:TnsA endonuclease N-terminal domain-containing protein [Rhodoferax sediminis]QDL36378.1 hypothetical protein EUB48_02970 [Rhodoferax sediminis]
MKPSNRKVVKRAPHRTVRVINQPHTLTAPVECESELERDFVRRATLFPWTKAVIHQPFVFELASQRRYTTDYLVELVSGQKIVVEVKHSHKVEEYRDTFDQAKCQAVEAGMTFLVSTEKQLQTGGINERVSMLMRYNKACFDGAKSAATVEAVDNCPQGIALAALREMTGVSLPHVLHLVARRRLVLPPPFNLAGDTLIHSIHKFLEGDHAIFFAQWIDAKPW